MELVGRESWLVESGGVIAVEEIGCQSEAMVVVLNKTEPGLLAWMQDPNAQPVAYVVSHKTRTPCGIALKGLNGLPNYNLTIPYGPVCGLQLADLEPSYETAETTIALEDNNDPNSAKPMRYHHVFCLYTRRVNTMRFKDISTGHQVVASTGGKPKPKVKMLFKTKDGRPIRAAKFGDEISFSLSLDPDNAYKAIAPRKCMFSDRERMDEVDAKRLTFVESHCPVEGMSEIISPLEDIDETVYRSSFRTFRFGNKSTLYAHCSVEVCLDQARCRRSCFNRVSLPTPSGGQIGVVANASTATQFDTDTLDRLRPVAADAFRRFRRQLRTPAAANELTADLSVSHALTILDDEETDEIAPAAAGVRGLTATMGAELERELQSVCGLGKAWTPFHLLLVALSLSLLVAVTTAICLATKLRQQTKDIENRALVSASPSSFMGTYQTPLTLPRAQLTGSAELVLEDCGSLPDSNRSVSEITVPHSRPQHAWHHHSIPRLNKAYY